MRKSFPFVLGLASLAGCGTEDRPDHAKAVAALHQAVTAKDVAAVQHHLARGVNPLASAANGDSALKAGLLLVTGKVQNKNLGVKRWSEADPGLKVMRLLMASVRRMSGKTYDETGVMQIGLQQGAFDSNRGGSTMISVKLVAAVAVSGELAISRWETELIGIERQRDWNPVLRPGGRYRVTGVVIGAAVEVERIELKSPPARPDSVEVPTVTYLPSTFEKMKALTWVGEVYQ